MPHELPIAVLLDTGVIWDYLRYASSHEAFLNRGDVEQKRKDDVISFERLISQPHAKLQIKWHYNSSTDYKIKEKFATQWDEMKTTYQLEKVPIPLIKADGRHKFDGSALYGGTMGGSLSILTTSEKERFDTEHLETALEHNMNYWLTVDYAKIEQVLIAIDKFKDKLPPSLGTIIKTPSQLLAEMEK